MGVVVSNCNSKFRRFIKKSGKKYDYVYYELKDPKIVELLRECSFEEVKVADYPERFKEEFIQAYIDLVGNI